MQTWEYTSVLVPIGGWGGPKVQNLEHALNNEVRTLGSEGWELVSSVSFGDQTRAHVLFVFKRPGSEG